MMKLLLFLTLLRAVARVDALPNGAFELQGRRYPVNGLTPPQRVCAGVTGVVLNAYLCAQGASGAWDKITKSCYNSNGDHSVGYQCILNQVEHAAILALGGVGTGAGVAFAFGYNFGVGVVREAAANVPLAGRDLAWDEESRDMKRAVIPQKKSNETWMTVLPPVNRSIPLLTFDEVAKNHDFPFVFEKDGWMSTYFPEGFEMDPSLMHHHVHHGANASEIPIGIKRYAEPESLGLRTVKRQEPYTCSGNVYSPSAKGFSSVTANPGYGFYFEDVAACGHPSRVGQSSWQSDLISLFHDTVNHAKSVNRFVAESEIHNKAGDSYVNVRAVGETQQFDDCFEGQHITAYCD